MPIAFEVHMDTTMHSLSSAVDDSPRVARETVADTDAGTTIDGLATKVFLATMAYVVIFIVAAVLLVA